jgi:hypothetical protein
MTSLSDRTRLNSRFAMGYCSISVVVLDAVDCPAPEQNRRK